MYCFNIIITEKCNANCSHCYMKKNGEKPISLTKNQVNEIVNKIPDNTKKIVLTGGEIFMEKELLMYAIDKINGLQKNIDIELESNGIYFYEENALRKLMEFNKKISSIRFSDDPFHESGGIDLKKVRDLKKYQFKLEYEIKYLVQDKALNIGNGEKLNKNLVKKSNCMNTDETKLNPYFFLDISGNIYLCPWKIIKPIGNIFLDDMHDVLKRLNDVFNKRILVGKIEDAFSLNNRKREEYEEYTKKYGQCMLCHKFFKEKK